jgi:hypothetical protein
MRGGSFLKRPLPHLTDEVRMDSAATDEQLSDVCRDIEARLVAEGASVEQWQEYEVLRERYVARMFAAARAG